MEAGGSRAALKRARKKQSAARPPPPERQPTAASADKVVGKKRDKRKDKRAAKRKLQEVEAAGDEPDELEGVVVDGELLLRDPSSGAVYASERDERGALVAVGRWEAGKVVPLAVAALSEAAAPAPAPSVPHPVPKPLAFDAAEDDHCETAPEAYVHIAGALQLLAATLGVAAAELRIYDPFYCNGAVERHLAALGFPCVHNRNEDFYAVLQEGRVPPHDVVVTAPALALVCSLCSLCSLCSRCSRCSLCPRCPLCPLCLLCPLSLPRLPTGDQPALLWLAPAPPPPLPRSEWKAVARAHAQLGGRPGLLRGGGRSGTAVLRGAAQALPLLDA